MDTPNDNNPESNILPPNQDDGDDGFDVITRLRGKHAANFATLGRVVILGFGDKLALQSGI